MTQASELTVPIMLFGDEEGELGGGPRNLMSAFNGAFITDEMEAQNAVTQFPVMDFGWDTSLPDGDHFKLLMVKRNLNGMPHPLGPTEAFVRMYRGSFLQDLTTVLNSTDNERAESMFQLGLSALGLGHQVYRWMEGIRLMTGLPESIALVEQMMRDHEDIEVPAPNVRRVLLWSRAEFIENGNYVNSIDINDLVDITDTGMFDSQDESTDYCIKWVEYVRVLVEIAVECRQTLTTDILGQAEAAINPREE